MEVAVDPLWRGEQVKHLPQGKLKVHLLEMEEPPQVLVAFGTRCVPRSVSGAQGTVALPRGGRQHAAKKQSRGGG